jgi:hypothetical protein
MSWYERHREQALAYQKEYSICNRDHYIDYQKKYYTEVLKPRRDAIQKEKREKRLLELEMKAKEVPAKPEKPIKPVVEKVKQPRQPRKVKYEPQFMRTHGEYTLTFN